MGTSSGANFQQQLPQGMPPPRHNGRAPALQTSLSLAAAASSEQAGSPPDTNEPSSSSDHGEDSATESASSQGTWPGEPPSRRGGGGPVVAATPISAVRIVDRENEVVSNGVSELQAVRRIPSAGRITLREVARERVEIVAAKMKTMSEELLDEIKTELRSILEGTAGSRHIEEFIYLQKLVQGRADLTLTTLSTAHHVQLEILVTIKTGIQAFLHPSVDIPQSSLAEIFLHRRCRNIACQSTLPAEECRCSVCADRNGFCNLCMCVICSKFDFEVNTCRWIGCDVCSHWTHTDCAIRGGRIGTGQMIKGGAEMLFRCQACEKTSELFGWVRDVFQQCAPGWDRDALLRELDYVCRIFRLSEDSKGRKLFRNCVELIERLRSAPAESMSPRMLLQALQELDIDPPRRSLEIEEEPGRLITPAEACARIAEVAGEAVRKMEAVAEEKLRACKRARLTIEAYDRELEQKAARARDLAAARQLQRRQVEELEGVARLKQAEAEMFRAKAGEARREAERLRAAVAAARAERVEQDYLRRRLEEAEAEKRCIFERIRMREEGHRPAGSGAGRGEQATTVLSKIEDLLKNVRSVPPRRSDDCVPEIDDDNMSRLSL